MGLVCKLLPKRFIFARKRGDVTLNQDNELYPERDEDQKGGSENERAYEI